MDTLLKNSAPTHARGLEEGLPAIEKARTLHERLIEELNLAPADKAKIAREIAGLLFTMEAGWNLPTHVRHALTRLRMDADHRAGLSDAEGLRSPSEVWDHYERLQAAAA